MYNHISQLPVMFASMCTSYRAIEEKRVWGRDYRVSYMSTCCFWQLAGPQIWKIQWTISQRHCYAHCCCWVWWQITGIWITRNIKRVTKMGKAAQFKLIYRMQITYRVVCTPTSARKPTEATNSTDETSESWCLNRAFAAPPPSPPFTAKLPPIVKALRLDMWDWTSLVIAILMLINVIKDKQSDKKTKCNQTYKLHYETNISLSGLRKGLYKKSRN